MNRRHRASSSEKKKGKERRWTSKQAISKCRTRNRQKDEKRGNRKKGRQKEGKKEKEV